MMITCISCAAPHDLVEKGKPVCFEHASNANLLKKVHEMIQQYNNGTITCGEFLRATIVEWYKATQE